MRGFFNSTLHFNERGVKSQCVKIEYKKIGAFSIGPYFHGHGAIYKKFLFSNNLSRNDDIMRWVSQ